MARAQLNSILRTDPHMITMAPMNRFRWLREARSTFALGLPIMSGLVGQTIIGLVDTIMVGRVGVVPLAAAAFVNTLAHLPFVFSLGLLSAIAPAIAQATGARRPREAGELLRHGLALSALVGLSAALVLAALRPFLRCFGQPPEVVAAAGSYLWLFAASLVPALLVHGCKQFFEAVRQPWTPACMLLGGVLLNGFLNWLWIYGHWGFPAMGLNGAGWATLVTRTIMAVAFAICLLRAPALRSYRPTRWRARLAWPLFRQLLAIGLPAGAQQLIEITAFSLAALMAGWLDTRSLAAHQIAMNCAALSFMFALGMGMAACIRVGRAHGAEQWRRRRRAGFAGMTMAAAVMGAFGLVFLAARGPLARVFVSDVAVAALAAQLLALAALFQVADGLQVSALCALRGLNDVRIPIVISGAAYWLIALPLGYGLAFPGHLGAVGIWTGLAVGLGVSAAALSWRFHRLTLPERQ